MPFPTADCAEVPQPDGCCSTIWDQGRALLTAVAAPVLACSAESCCGSPLRAFTSQGRPELWQSDLLTVWAEGIGLSSKSISSSQATVTPPTVRVIWRVYLIESCYPSGRMEGGQFVTPTESEFDLANLHVYAHGEAMLRGILTYAADNPCTSFVLRDFQPIQPTAGPSGDGLGTSTGWSASVGLDWSW